MKSRWPMKTILTILTNSNHQGCCYIGAVTVIHRFRLVWFGFSLGGLFPVWPCRTRSWGAFYSALALAKYSDFHKNKKTEKFRTLYAKSEHVACCEQQLGLRLAEAHHWSSVLWSCFFHYGALPTFGLIPVHSVSSHKGPVAPSMGYWSSTGFTEWPTTISCTNSFLMSSEFTPQILWSR